MTSIPSVSFQPAILPPRMKPNTKKSTLNQPILKPTSDVFFSGKPPSPTQQLENLLSLANNPTERLQPEDVRKLTFELLAQGANLEHQKNGKSLLEHLEALKLYSDEAHKHAESNHRSEAEICSFAGCNTPEFSMRTFAPEFKPEIPAFDTNDLNILHSWKGSFNKSAQWKPSHQSEPNNERTPLLEDKFQG